MKNLRQEDKSTVGARRMGSRDARAWLPWGAVAFSALCLVGTAPQAEAQVTLTLTPVVTTVAVGSTTPIKFMLDLTGGTDIFSYNTNVDIDNTDLAFSGPFVSTFSGFDFSGPNAVTGGNSMNISASAFANPDVNNTDPTTGLPNTISLGYFMATLNPTASTGVTSIDLTSISTDNSGSSVFNGSGDQILTAVAGSTLTVTPAAAPEPSQDAAIGLGVLGLGALGFKARRKLSAGVDA